ncbi:MAG: hypothetical protein IH984_10900 [Planctomycetes bacterium]|nr:hypothetical protein [Planctomycetota bacterium]
MILQIEITDKEQAQAWTDLQLLMRKMAEGNMKFSSQQDAIKQLCAVLRCYSKQAEGSPQRWFKCIKKGIAVEVELRASKFQQLREKALQDSRAANSKVDKFKQANETKLQQINAADSKSALLKSELLALQDTARKAEDVKSSLEDRATSFYNVCVEFPSAFIPYKPWHEAEPPRPAKVVETRLVPTFNNLPIFYTIMHISQRLVGDRYGSLGPLTFLSLKPAEAYATSLGDNYIAFKSVLTAVSLVEFTVESCRPAFLDLKPNVPLGEGMCLFDRPVFKQFSPNIKDETDQEEWRDAIMREKTNQLITTTER